MKATASFLSCLALAGLACLPAAAAPVQGAPQGPGLAETVASGMQADERCRSRVSRFEESIGLVRQTQGTQVAAELKERLLPARLEMEILFKEGYCGLAEYLRGRKLID